MEKLKSLQWATNEINLLNVFYTTKEESTRQIILQVLNTIEPFNYENHLNEETFEKFTDKILENKFAKEL